MNLTDELKFRIGLKFGRQIAGKYDARLLCEDILTSCNERISESTIRRLFGMIPSKHSPSHYTLDVLARYIGYRNHDHFSDDVTGTIERAMSSSPESASFGAAWAELQHAQQLSLLELLLLTDYLNALILSNQPEKAAQFFNNPHLFQLITQDDTLHEIFAHQLGPAISKTAGSFQPQILLNQPFFTPAVLHRYVDIANPALEIYYHTITQNPPNPQARTFAFSILTLNALHERNAPKALQYFEYIKLDKLSFPAPLSGRLALLHWVFNRDDAAFLKAGDAFRKEIDFFSIDVVPFLLIHDHIPLLKKWLSRYQKDLLKRRNWVSFSLKKMYREAMAYSGISTDSIPDEGLYYNKYLLSSSNHYRLMQQKIEQRAPLTTRHV